MNKRFFTLMAAVMLAGAPLCNEVYAQTTTEIATNDAVYSSTLKNGLKFYLRNGAKYISVDNVSGTNYVIMNTSATTLADATVFEIKSYSNKTFQLWTKDGKQVLSDATDKSTTFFAVKNSAVTDKADFIQIKYLTADATTAGKVLTPSSAVFTEASYAVNDLNANMSNNGFKLSFPGLVVEPETNLFSNQLVAIDAADITALNSGWSVTGTMFALADEAGLKLKGDATNADNWKAATFVVVDPNTNFGITGLDATAGEGFSFTTIKGSKLAAQNKKKDGEIAYVNGVYAVSEDDQLNAEDELTISIANAKVVNGSNENDAVSGLKAGVYTLTTGGLKSYVTTAKANASKLTKATLGGNTYAAAADLLKAGAPAVYNVFYVGVPEIGDASSKKGKYEVAATATAAGHAAVAPAKTNVNFATAQWVVSSVGAKGAVELTNMGNQSTMSLNLYKTDNAGEYQTSSGDIIKLIPATEKGTFLKMTKAQTKQGAQIQFKGSDNMVSENIYMKKDAAGAVTATNDATKNIKWRFVEADPINLINTYAYLKDNEIKTANDTLTVAAYKLFDENDKVFSWNGTKTVVADPANAHQILPYVFQQNANGSYTMWNVANPTTPYAACVKTDGTIIGRTAGNVPDEYSTVSLSFYDLGESLPAVARYATLDSEEGSISLKEKNGIVEGIIASEGLTFWLDTADTNEDAVAPTFYISKGIAKAETKAVELGSVRNFLYHPADSAYQWNAAKAEYVSDTKYTVDGTQWDATAGANSDLKAIFRPAALVGVDTLNTTAAGKEVVVTKKNGLDNFKFYIAKDAEADGYIAMNAGADEFLYNLNGKLAFTADPKKALVFNLGEGDPTANEAIATENVAVIAGEGVVTVKGAAGKQVVVSNILGQVIANKVATSDEETIAVAAGVAVVVVDGEATKVVVK